MTDRRDNAPPPDGWQVTPHPVPEFLAGLSGHEPTIGEHIQLGEN